MLVDDDGPVFDEVRDENLALDAFEQVLQGVEGIVFQPPDDDDWTTLFVEAEDVEVAALEDFKLGRFGVVLV